MQVSITQVRATVIQERAFWARDIENIVAIGPDRQVDERFGAARLPAPGSLLVEIDTNAGLTGLGLGGGGWAAKHVLDKLLTPLLMGQDPACIDTLWQQMHHANLRYAQAGLMLMAMSGIDLALWDLCGRLANQPVYALLGGKACQQVPVYATVRDPAWAQAQGFWGIKLGAPYGPADGRQGMAANEAAVAQARQQIGPDMALMIDCSSHWTVPYALEMMRILAPYDLYFIEEPVPPWDIDGYATLRRRINTTRIAGGEHAFTRYAAHNLLAHDAVDILQPDIRWTGGLSEMRQIMALAEQHGVPVMPHRGAMAWSLHAMVNCCSGPAAEGMALTPQEAERSLFVGEPVPEQGMIQVSDAPGFGLSLRPERISQLPAEV